MNKVRFLSKIVLAVSLVLTMAFTLSCSDDKEEGGGGGGGICLHQGIGCYEGLTEAQCKMIEENEYKEGSCPSDWLKCPVGGGVINYFHPDFVSDCPE